MPGLGRDPTPSFLLEISQSKSTSIQASRYHDSTSEKNERGKMPAGDLNKEQAYRQKMTDSREERKDDFQS